VVGGVARVALDLDAEGDVITIEAADRPRTGGTPARWVDRFSDYAQRGRLTTTTATVQGKPITETVQCTAADIKTAAASSDSGESEMGPSEAAENGKED